MSRCRHNWPGTRPALRLVADNSDADRKTRELRDAFDEVMDELSPKPRVPRIPARGPARIPVGRPARLPELTTARAGLLAALIVTALAALAVLLP